MTPFYVFGYGSLLWRPGFPFVRAESALAIGRHRSLCVFSWVHRGTREQPGLVLGLDRGGACRGLVFEVDPAERDGVIDYLQAREQVTMVYRERTLPVRLAGGRSVEALTFVVDRTHPQYAGVLPPQQLLDIVRAAKGQSGHNADYVIATADHLDEMGIRDRTLDFLAGELRPGSQRG